MGFKLNNYVISEMKRQAEILIEHKVSPTDIQFLISADRKQVVMIDPEFFTEDLQMSREDAFHNLNMVYLNWKMDGRIEP